MIQGNIREVGASIGLVRVLVVVVGECSVVLGAIQPVKVSYRVIS